MKFLKKQVLMSDISKLTDRIRRDKRLLALIIGSLLLLAMLLVSSVPKDEKEAGESATLSQQSYEKDIEERLSELISAIEGAGKTKVMVTLENSQESIYARNSDIQNEEGEINRSQSGQEYVIIKNGNEEKGLELKTVYPGIAGVAVVCDGAESPLVRQRIITTVTAVLSVSTAKVSVVKMRTEGK